MKRLTFLTRLILVAGLFLATAGSGFATVTLTGASGGGSVSADTASNAPAPAWTSLGAITITEGASTDFTNGTGVTLVLKTPAGFQFNTAVIPSVTFTAGKNITSASIAMTDASTMTVTLTVSGTAVAADSLTIGSTTNLQVRPTATVPLATGNHIYRPSTGGGNAGIRGITNSVDGSTGSNFGSLTEAPGIPSSVMPSQTRILSDLKLANKYFTNEWPTAGCSSCLTGSRPTTIWTRATYFEGALAMWRVNQDPAITNYATQWGTFHNWTLRNGAIDTTSDNVCAGSEYIELYQLTPALTNRITNIVANLNYVMSSVGSNWWYYIDCLHMSGPAFAKMAAISGSANTNYAYKLYQYFHCMKSTFGRSNGLYNPYHVTNVTDHLWVRDTNFLANYKASDGTTQKCYWSRGNGWVFAGLARTLDVLPASDAHFAEYVQTFQEMAAALKAVQRADGFWNMNLAYTNDYAGPESSGSSMFTYGLAWGIHHGYLDATYLPTVIKGWNALATYALHPTNSADAGFIGFVQNTGSYPTNNPPASYTNDPDFDDYTLGAFLLAGSEVYQLTNLSQTITFGTLSNSTYGAAPVTLNATASSGLPVSFSIVSGPAALDGNTLTITGAGTVIVRAAQSGDSTYAATNVNQSFTVSPLALTVSANATNKVYGNSDPAFSWQLTGGSLVPGDNFTGSLTRVAGEHAGSYAIQLGTLTAGDNYTLGFVPANLTIQPKPIAVAADPQSKMYGNADPTLTWQLTGGALVPGDGFAGSLARVTGENVGSYAITQNTLTAGTDYDLTFAGTNLVIYARAITVTADVKTKVYGNTDPELTYQVTGGSLVPGDGFTGSPTRATGEHAGSYAIARNTLTAGADYDLTFVGTNLVIQPRPITITADGKTKVYGNTDPELTCQVTAGALVPGDGITGSLARVAGENVGSYAIVQNTLTAGTDYDLAFGGTNLVINPRPIAVTADARSKVYGDADPDLTYRLTGGAFVPGDSFTGNLTRAAGESTGVHPILQGTLTAGANYDLTYTGADLVISQKALTITADNKSKTEGLPNPPLTAHYNGFVAGESTNVLTTQAILSTTANTDSPAGTGYPITVSGAAAANYSIGYVAGTLTVVGRPDLTGIRDGEEQYTLSWPTLAGQNYQVEYKDNLDDATWSPLTVPLAGTGNLLNVIDYEGNTPHRFYRLKLTQP
jgi:rhamnogalacturonyl hydrolase YesR